jgi:penicillin-binding protein 2
MANVLAAVANRGAIYKPRLVAQIGEGADAEPVASEVLLETGIAPATLDAVRAALVAVTGSEVGTARSAFAGFPLAVAGKTGTAENPGGEPHAWFAGYAPAEDPKLVVAVMLENGGEGSREAAPLAREVFGAYFGVAP